MALVVEDGTGLSNADAYATESEVTLYHTNYTGSATWASATTTVRERAIRRATQFVDAHFTKRFKGLRLKSTQRLNWPRQYVQDSDGYDVYANSVPLQVRHAVAELAARALAGELMPDQLAGRIKREVAQVGSLREETEYTDGGRAQITTYTLVESLLGELLKVEQMERG